MVVFVRWWYEQRQTAIDEQNLLFYRADGSADDSTFAQTKGISAEEEWGLTQSMLNVQDNKIIE
jgi:hypothetical protein